MKCDKSFKRTQAIQRAINEHIAITCCFAAAGMNVRDASHLAYRAMTHPQRKSASNQCNLEPTPT